jgi:subtilase family serine protease
MDPALVAEQHALFARAVRAGMTLLASSGDQGSAQPSCDGTSFIHAASTPASDPAVTGVGGTRLDADGITGAYHGESVWNEPAFESAGGGGFSTIYRTPSFQRGDLHLHSRGVPDVAYNAAIIGGVLAVFTPGGSGAPGTYRFGGTSAGSPQWAGLIALADQAGRSRLGSVNSQLYAISHSRKAYAADFHDVTVGTNAYTYTTASGDQSTIPGYSATPGWDPASGLGSPRADVLVPALARMGRHSDNS